MAKFTKINHQIKTLSKCPAIQYTVNLEIFVCKNIFVVDGASKINLMKISVHY